MKYLCTGASGFVGKHLTKFLREGHEVVTTDHHGDVDECFDLSDVETLEDVLHRHKPDTVIHLAAQWGRVFGEDDPVNSVAQNAVVTMMLARATRDIGLVYASTSEIYGHHTEPIDETYVGFPSSVYGLTKRWGEDACNLYHPDGLTIARLSMPYGPGSPPGRGRRAMDTFMWLANHRRPITVHRGGERSWCYISDICDALLLVSEYPGVWHIGRDDDPRSMLEIAQRACALADVSADELINVVEPPADQVVAKKLSTAKLFGTGWRPKIDLDWGMTTVWAHIRHYDAFGRYHEVPLR